LRKQRAGFKQNCHGWVRSALASVLAVCILALPVSGCSSEKNILKQVKNLSSSSSSQVTLSAPSSSEIQSSRVKKKTVSAIKPAQKKAVSSSAPKKTQHSSTVRETKLLDAKLPPKAEATQKIVSGALATANYTAIKQDSSLQALSSQPEKTLYTLINESVSQIALQKNSSGLYPMGQVTVPQKLSEAQIRVSLTAYMDDHPKVFWIASRYSYGYQNGQTVLQLYSVLSPSECKAAIQKLSDVLASAVKSIPTGLSQFDRENSIFQYLVSHCSYDTAAVTDSSRWQAFTSYGALVDNKAVCEGYSRAMQLLSESVGLKCALLRGSSDGVNHMWNVMQIDGNWYNLDVTWCDNTVLIYNYFNIPDSVLKLTHQVSPLVSSLTTKQICDSEIQFNLFLPKCTATEENYFQKKGIHVSAFSSAEDTAVIGDLIPKLKSGETSIAFYIDKTSDYDTLISGMVSKAPYKMSAWLKNAAGQAGKTIDFDRVSYITDKSDRGLTVHIAYQ
jgi:hypothetical protein